MSQKRRANYKLNSAVINMVPEHYINDRLHIYESGTTYIQSILCLDDGVIYITPAGGDAFTWTAIRGQFIPVLTRDVNVISGRFLGTYNKKYADAINTIEFGWVNEYDKLYSDQDGNYYIMID